MQFLKCFDKTSAMLKAIICNFHMLIMFLQDAHMRLLWTGVHQEMELNSPCGDSSRNKDVVLMLRY